MYLLLFIINKKMKTLELNQMEVIEGGDIGDFVNGVCAALVVANYLGVIALMATPGGQVVAGACLVNLIGNGAGWW